MIKPFSTLGDTWLEVICNTILLILMGPFILIVLILTFLHGLVAKLLPFPGPKIVPIIIKNNEEVSELKFKAYIDRLNEELNGYSIEFNDESAYISSRFASVCLSYEYGLSISLVGQDRKLDTGYWHTNEEENIDIFFWYAVAALRYGVFYRKNLLGRQIGWVYSEEMSIWMGVSSSKSENSNFYSFTAFSRKIKA